MSTIHLRKLIATLVRERSRDAVIGKLHRIRGATATTAMTHIAIQGKTVDLMKVSDEQYQEARMLLWMK